jgi:hypothetical protein
MRQDCVSHEVQFPKVYETSRRAKTSMSIQSGTCHGQKGCQQEKSINTKQNSSLENHIVVFLLAQNIYRLFLLNGDSSSSRRCGICCLLFCCLLPGREDLSICGSNVPLLLA